MIYLIIAAALLLATSLVILGKRNPDYSHVRHTISELGAHGFADEQWVAYASFLPYGVAMAVVAFVYRAYDPILLLAGGLAIGYIGAALFPCDADAPAIGTTRNGLHVLAALFEYLMTIAAFEIVGRDSGFPFTAMKFLVLGFCAMVSMPIVREYRGLAQRVIELIQVVGLGYFVCALT